MKKIFILLSFLIIFSVSKGNEKLIIVNEGLWQTDNGRLSYFASNDVESNRWFRDVNGYKIGDTPTDIVQINENLLAISVNWSNIVQFITADGRAVGVTEDIPNNRRLATDGKFVYATSFAHEVAIDGKYKKFKKGYVAKIDAASYKVVDAVEVGYEPDGISIYDGYIFVANTGGYAFQENHDYESTICVIDSESLEVIRILDTGQGNLHGKISRSGKYLCISSPGDYYTTKAATIIVDCEAVISGKAESECFYELGISSTVNCVNSEDKFFAIGSYFSYLTGKTEFNHVIIDPQEVFESKGEKGVTQDFPGTMKKDISTMTMPYAMYVNPYSGYIYATDAGSYTSSGTLYQWTPEGILKGKYKLYINPCAMIALPSEEDKDKVDSHFIDCLTKDKDEIFDLNGLKVKNPKRGKVYIVNGRKKIFNDWFEDLN